MTDTPEDRGSPTLASGATRKAEYAREIAEDCNLTMRQNGFSGSALTASLGTAVEVLAEAVLLLSSALEQSQTATPGSASPAVARVEGTRND